VTWERSSHIKIFFVVVVVVVVVVIVSGIFVFIVLLVVSLSESLVAVGLVDCHIYIYLRVDCCYHFFVVHVGMFR
jgi:hypothetical protein